MQNNFIKEISTIISSDLKAIGAGNAISGVGGAGTSIGVVFGSFIVVLFKNRIGFLNLCLKMFYKEVDFKSKLISKFMSININWCESGITTSVSDGVGVMIRLSIKHKCIKSTKQF